jgi:hypothetical protein
MADSVGSIEFALQISLGARTDGGQDPVQRLRTPAAAAAR